MKALRRTVFAAGAAVALSATTAQAQVFFDNYCVSGSYQVCASVRVFSSGPLLTMQVWNLENVESPTDDPTTGLGLAHTITSVGLYHSGTAWAGTVNDFSASWVTGPNPGDRTDVTGSWSQPANDISTLAGINLEASGGSSGNDGINGCTLLPGGTKWQTCASFAGVPYMEFQFVLSSEFSLDDLELRWHSQQTGWDNEGSLKCDTGGAGDYPACGVVPEPITMVLVGSGLLGIGGVGLRRRRKGLDVVSE